MECFGRNTEDPSDRRNAAGEVARSGGCQAQGGVFGGVGDHGDDGYAVVDGGESPSHRLSGGFGHQVPPAPGRTFLTHGLHHGMAEFVTTSRGTSSARSSNGVSLSVTPARAQGRIVAECLGRAGPPLGGQLRQGPDVLLRAGAEGGLGSELHDRRWGTDAAHAP